jgi:hypothetical protein
MIGKIGIGKSFRGCISYCLEGRKATLADQKALKGEIVYFNRCFGDKKDLINQFQQVRRLNQKQSKPVLHASLSFAYSDKVSSSQKIEIAQKLALDLGFKDNQYLVIEHQDTLHPHIHIIANRIGFNGKTVSDSNNYQKISTFCRKIEREYNLTEVLSPKKFLSQAEKALPRKDNRKEALKEAIKDSISKSSGMTEFLEEMKAKGYATEVARGIAFIDDKLVRFKGSQVGYSLSDIQNSFQKENKEKISNQIYQPRSAQSIKLKL